MDPLLIIMASIQANVTVLRCLAPLSKLTNESLRDGFKNIADIVSSFDEVRTYSD